MPIQDKRKGYYNAFVGCFKEATANVADEYMNFIIQGSPSIYRERVYCYELYHQLRLSMSDDFFGYSLNGEVDKSGNRAMIGEGITGTKPDLLVHKPGTMAGNLSVVEVKPVTANNESVQEDLSKLIAYTNRADYFRGIYLIYGNDHANFNRIFHIVQNLIQQYPPDIGCKINLFWHKATQEAAEKVNLLTEA